MSRALPYLWYPLLFAGAIVAFAAMLAAGVTLVVATYLPTLVAGLAIVALELQFPERLEWRPRRADVAADVAFMALVQILLQRVLLVLAVFAIATWMHGHAPSPWWPHGWTLGAQMVAMLLAVDFMRYWVHRACHTYTPLWRLHEVHHSPGILYTLNVGRFHPLEKILHFACDSVPFLLLGVAPEVIGGYFLLYAVNGFFQHSNLRVRYGWLNYVVGSAETHRWHHARDPRTAYCNFGNTTIVWDLLFRTWYLPTAGPVDDIGIMDTTYPKGFWAQMLTPFRAAAPARRRLARRLADVSIPRYLRLMGFVERWRVAGVARRRNSAGASGIHGRGPWRLAAVLSNREAIEQPGERPTDLRPGLPARPAVLIVEDDSLLRITTASYLRDEGFDVIEVADADQAIRVLGYTAVDAVFSDVSRPGSANSLTLGRWLRPDEATNRVSPGLGHRADCRRTPGVGTAS